MKNPKDPKTFRFPMSFTEEDLMHCFSCMLFVEYLLDPDTDGEPSTLNVKDVEYLERLLYRDYMIMRTVIQASGGSDNVI